MARKRTTPRSPIWIPDRDAVSMLLVAFGYPTIPPEPPQSGTRRVHKAITEQDDDDEET